MLVVDTSGDSRFFAASIYLLYVAAGACMLPPRAL